MQSSLHSVLNGAEEGFPLTGIDEELVGHSRMVHIMNGSSKQRRQDLQISEDRLSGERSGRWAGGRANERSVRNASMLSARSLHEVCIQKGSDSKHPLMFPYRGEVQYRATLQVLVISIS